jgi:hypothetical protein
MYTCAFAIGRPIGTLLAPGRQRCTVAHTEASLGPYALISVSTRRAH